MAKDHIEEGTSMKELTEETDELMRELKTEINHEGKLQIFNCHLCPYRSRWRDKVKRHLKAVHTNIKDFKCDVCGHAFTQKSHFEAHKKAVHDRIRDHKCGKCERAFSAKAELKKHVGRVHDRKEGLATSNSLEKTNEMLTNG